MCCSSSSIIVQLIMSLSILVMLLLMVCGFSSAQGTGDCSPDPPITLVSGTGTLSNGVPSISTNTAGKMLHYNSVLPCVCFTVF